MVIKIHYTKQISSINKRMELNIHSHLLVKLLCLMKLMRKLRNKLQMHVDIQICCIAFSPLDFWMCLLLHSCYERKQVTHTIHYCRITNVICWILKDLYDFLYVSSSMNVLIYRNLQAGRILQTQCVLEGNNLLKYFSLCKIFDNKSYHRDTVLEKQLKCDILLKCKLSWKCQT